MTTINFDLIKVIPSSKLTNFNIVQLNDVVKSAMSNEYIGTSVEWWEKVDKQVIIYNDKVIGFFCPRKVVVPRTDGTQTFNQTFTKSGTIFILPDYRSCRISLYVLSNWCKDNIPCVAYIDDCNSSSIKLFTALGYVPLTSEITNQYNGHIGRFYMLEDTETINQLTF